MKRNYLLLAPLAALLLVGCGGHDNNAPAPAVQNPATGLAYTDPAAPAGEWKLVKDATSTSTRLVLNLVGPSDGTKYRGVGFTLQGDSAKAKFAQFKDNEGKALGYFQDGGVFLDKDSAGADTPATLQAGGLKGDKLMVGIFQKTDEALFGAAQGAVARDCNKVLLQVAIDFDPALKAPAGSVPLSVLKARAIPEEIGTLATRKAVDVKLNVGTLALK